MWVSVGICVVILSCGAVYLRGREQRKILNAGRTNPFASPTASLSPTPTPTPTPTPAEEDAFQADATPTPEAVATPVPTVTPSGLCGGRYDVFTDGEVIKTEDSYRSREMAAFLSHVEETNNRFTGTRLLYYVVDIYLQDIGLMRSNTVNGEIKDRTMSIRRMAEVNEAVVAISGDFSIRQKNVVSVRDGVVGRTSENPQRDTCAVYRDGKMETFELGVGTGTEILAADPWQVWCFGPNLLDADGKPKKEFNSTVQARNARAAIGYYEPGHYCLVMVVSRSKISAGVSMKELAVLMETLGCAVAYNLDGGHTAQLYFNGQVIGATKNPRHINDIIYFPLAKGQDNLPPMNE